MQQDSNDVHEFPVSCDTARKSWNSFVYNGWFLALK